MAMNGKCFGTLVFGLLVALLSTLAATKAWAGLCVFCGSNAATVGDGTVFDELNVKGDVRGKPKASGRRKASPKIMGATLGTPSQPVTLSVKRDVLGATLPDGTSIIGTGLVGLVITIEASGGRTYDLTLTKVDDTLAFWAEPAGFLMGYDFTVTERKRKGRSATGGAYSTADGQHLCTAKHIEATSIYRPGQEFTAIVFEGDRFNDDHTVTDQPAGWFNLACFGTAAAKMHLLRHTRAGTPRDGSVTTTLDERTAMLRAITADYCADGRAWTGDGTPLWWTDRAQRFPLRVQPGFASFKAAKFGESIEAVWDAKGKLLCLNDPRRLAGPAPNPNTCTAPVVERATVTAGKVACPNLGSLPHCKDFVWSGMTARPWSAAPLVGTAAAPKGILPDAYIITVNRPGDGDYCETRSISWP
jgi:hypothetical protein